VRQHEGDDKITISPSRIARGQGVSYVWLSARCLRWFASRNGRSINYSRNYLGTELKSQSRHPHGEALAAISFNLNCRKGAGRVAREFYPSKQTRLWFVWRVKRNSTLHFKSSFGYPQLCIFFIFLRRTCNYSKERHRTGNKTARKKHVARKAGRVSRKKINRHKKHPP
jgi:hypothetical protein